MSEGDPEYSAAAAGWVAHLRSGGTTPWPEWPRDPGRPVVPGTASGDDLPGAAQLELLRRLNALGPQPARAGHVLRRSATGRGAVDLRLPWPPARPAADRELLRVAAGVLADLVAVLPDPAPPVRRWRPPPLRRRGPAWVLEGPPCSVAGMREGLAAAGRPTSSGRRWPWSHRRDPDLVVIAVAPLEEGLHEAWTRRAEKGPVGTWLRFLASCVERDRLPPGLEVGALARRWADRVGPEAVHVVARSAAAGAFEQLLGVRVPGARLAPVVPLGPAHTELLRRVSNVMPFVVPADELPRRRGAFVAHLREDAAEWDPTLGPRRLALPDEVEPWLEGAGRRLREELDAVGCRVHGDVGALLLDRTGAAAPEAPAGADRELRVRHDRIVAAAVRMIHRVGRVVDRVGVGRQG
ncbi:hypothetical protein [Nocardioides caldifontis]|uniref:hypothetical protein n=1 Tax=Nocardioides caldifontis TaxID=2588938 RepID=UPI0011DF80E5|nr:hypothetical protein [Nocardioides caldifontis]